MEAFAEHDFRIKWFVVMLGAPCILCVSYE